MADYNYDNVSNGIDIISVPSSQFKTNEISVTLLMPLDEREASLNALVSMLICQSSKEFPSLSKLNLKLASLYGATLVPQISKNGELHSMKIGVTSIDDRFSLDDKKISLEVANLLLSLLFEPDFDNDGFFTEKNVQNQKALLLQKLESEENEKRIYSLIKMQEAMFKGEPYAINKYGTRETISSITKEEVTAQWKKIISSAKVLMTVVGSANISEIEKMLKERFSSVSRKYKKLPEPVFKPVAEKVNTVREEMDVKQGKLVLGYRVNITPSDNLYTAMRSFADAFGGGPYSKLFMNVREKMSLCYYCSARYNRRKNFLYIQCGCEEENMDKAIKEIDNQLNEIKKGNFDTEFNSSKIAITDAINSVNDAPESIETWYSVQMNDKEIISPKESAKENNAVTKEQIIECANRISLDTVYKLVSIGEGE